MAETVTPNLEPEKPVSAADALPEMTSPEPKPVGGVIIRIYKEKEPEIKVFGSIVPGEVPALLKHLAEDMWRKL